MKLKDIHSQELLPEFASDVVFAAEAFDKMMRYAAMRVDSLPAPLTLESALELTDEEQAAYFEQYGLAKYYPDISHDKRSWMLWMQNKLWRYLGTPNSIETLCSYLFDDIPATSFSTLASGNIGRNLLDIGTSIGRTARTAASSHHLIVRNIVAHVHHLLILQAIFLQELMVGLDLHGTTHKDVLHSKTGITLPYRLGIAARQDGDAKPHLLSQLDGISILDIDRSERLTITGQRDGLSRKNAIHVEDDGFDFI